MWPWPGLVFCSLSPVLKLSLGKHYRASQQLLIYATFPVSRAPPQALRGAAAAVFF